MTKNTPRQLSFSFEGFAILGLGIVAFLGLVAQDRGNDIQLYLRAAQGLAAGKWPYTGFPLEYPPGALLAFLPPYLPGGEDSYFPAFALWSVFLAGVIAFSLRKMLALWPGPEAPNPALAGRSFAALCTWMCFLIAGRFDIFPAALTALALWGVLGRQRARAGVALGIAIAAKLYPVVFAPILFGWLLARGEKRPALAFGLALTLTVVLCFLPFVLHSPQKLMSFVEYHRLRGLQIESGAAGLAMLLGNGNRTNFDYGAIHLEGPLARQLLPMLTYLFPLFWLAALVRTYFRFREEASETALIECSAGALLLFMALNKVFSPQFMIWLIPFFPLLKPRWRVWGTPLFAATTLIFPFFYGKLMAGDTELVLLLNARNFGVLILGLLLLWGGPPTQEKTERYESP